MHLFKAAIAAPVILSTLVLAGPAAADPGQYRYDVCHDTGVDDVSNVGLTCSADAAVQGYGGEGAHAYAYAEVVVTSPDGEPVVVYDDGVEPTGAVVRETGKSPTEWVSISSDGVVLDTGTYVVDVHDRGDSASVPVRVCVDPLGDSCP